jgi:ryanodine receptor 2
VVKPGPVKRLFNFINAVKELEIEHKEEEEPQKKSPEGKMLVLNLIT